MPFDPTTPEQPGTNGRDATDWKDGAGVRLPPDIMTAEDVARYLHCSKAHVYNAINGKIENVGALPSLSLGRRRLVRRATLESWIEANETVLASGTMPPKPETGTAGRMERNHATTVPRRKSA